MSSKKLQLVIGQCLPRLLKQNMSPKGFGFQIFCLLRFWRKYTVTRLLGERFEFHAHLLSISSLPSLRHRTVFQAKTYQSVILLFYLSAIIFKCIFKASLENIQHCQ